MEYVDIEIGEGGDPFANQLQNIANSKDEM
jgi:hypothetical protein